jgi:hypothetical protein
VTFHVGNDAYRGPAVSVYHPFPRKMVRPALEGGYCGFERMVGRAERSAAARSHLQPKPARLVQSIRAALLESVDVWPLANIILRRNRGHALAGIRL